MIHSLAGGDIKDVKSFTFCLVEIASGLNKGMKLWYTSSIFDLKCGDEVIVPLGASNKQEKGVVLKIIKNARFGMTPVPVNKAKEIIKKL